MERSNRLQLKPYRAVSEHVDGAWWPRSTTLVDELPGLAASLSDRLGRIVMVGYHRNGWHDTPTLAQIDGHAIELLGFTSDEPASVIVMGDSGRHITLHVIRPDTEEDAARRELDAVRAPAAVSVSPAVPASVGRSVADVAEKLARHEGLGDERRTAQIRRWCDETAQRFIDAPVQTFVPILVEHIVRNRMMESRSRRYPADGGLCITVPGSSAPYSISS
ncbi:hypothetical protein DQP58_21100 [Mycobacterium colombiense]|uniref:Uncharacterized protein n=1 Tax=Mycobacterium colombiense TaxID=339268 RepID=A0A329K576_9MYCO|nr:DUF5994 family protein [Mycobacterium colombiense]RAU91194.1 hypothetical protein DQP58_21100 [Mycobacterium colombiense]